MIYSGQSGGQAVDHIKLHWHSRPYRDWRIVVSLLLILLLVGVRGYIWMATERYNQQTAAKQFDDVVRQGTADLTSQFEVYADTLYSGRALFLATTTTSRQQWATFVEAQNIEQRYPAVYSVAYVTAAARGQAAGLVGQLNAARLPNETEPIALHPAGISQQLAVLTYLAPPSADQNAIGFDLMTNPERARMLEAARDSGQPRASEPLALVTDKAGDPPSLLIALATYRAGYPVSSAKQRQTALRGYVVLALHSKPLLDAAFTNLAPGSSIHVTASAGGHTFYRLGSTVSAARDALHKTSTIGVAGQTWRLDFSAPGSFGVSASARLAPLIALGSTVPIAAIILFTLYLALNLRTVQISQSPAGGASEQQRQQ